MKIAIATTGRFWLLDLARELDTLGHDVAFYSYVPRTRAEKFGLPSRCHRGFLPYVAPILATLKYAPANLKPGLDHQLLKAMDAMIASWLEPCDVFIGLSGLCVKSAMAAKSKYGAAIFLERGSRHIFSQKEILEGIRKVNGKATRVPAFYVEREMTGYEIADTIVVPSRHVEKSFSERGVSIKKLFRNPYGVDLSMFPPTPVPTNEPPTVIFVGGWSLRKGCDVLFKAWKNMEDVNLVHVGAAGDAPMPNDQGFFHYDPVPQWELKEVYGRAHIFAMASREEGLSLVQAQALACGLPVVCTDRTGGEDLKDFLCDPSLITVVPVERHDVLAEALNAALSRATSMAGVRDLLGAGREKLSWRAYGERYDSKLMEVSPA